MTTYGIVYGTQADTTIIECKDQRDAYQQAVRVSIEQDVDVVVLEGAGPVLDADGEMIAPTHAPARTLYRLPAVTQERIAQLRVECGAAGDTEGVRICTAALTAGWCDWVPVADMLSGPDRDAGLTPNSPGRLRGFPTTP